MLNLKDLRVLFIGHFSENSSWGMAADDYIRCIEKHTSNIKTKDFPLGQSRKFSDSYGYKYANNNLNNYDILVQMCLPQFFCRIPNIKSNVGIFFSECEHSLLFKPLANIKLLDFIFTASFWEKKLWRDYHNVHKVLDIGLPININKANKSYPLIRDVTKKNNFTYTFYSISEDTERKNLDQLIKAYFLSFSAKDNVNLVLKVNHSSNIDQRIQDIKRRSRTHAENNYPPITIIKDWLTEDQIYGLHRSCDCYVSVALGEAWCYPILDAYIFGNHIICDNKGHKQMRGRSFSHFDSKSDTADIRMPPLQDYYTGRDVFAYPNTHDLAGIMGATFDEKRRGSNSDDDYPHLNTSFSYEEIGKKLLTTASTLENDEYSKKAR